MKEQSNSKTTMNVEVYFSKSPEICQKCGSKTKKVRLIDIPQSNREFFKTSMTLGVFKEKSSLVYCIKCKEYSLVTNTP